MTKLKEKPFWLHLLIIIALVIVVLFGFLQFLGLITKHGSYLTVPSVTGKSTTEAVKMLEDKGFEVLIQDSVYTDTAKKGTVLKQFPEPNSTVKVNRTVMLTVNRITLPMIDMPQLNGKSLGYALEIMKRSHLVLGDTTFKTSFELGSVLEQKFNGNIIESGTKIPWGSRIDLVIASGLSKEEIPLISVMGMSYGEAKSLLESSGIVVGLPIVVDDAVKDTAAAFVVRQIPPQYTSDHRQVYIKSGQVVDLFLSSKNIPISDSSNAPVNPGP